MKPVRFLFALLACLWTTAWTAEAFAQKVTVYSAGTVVVGQTKKLTA